MKERFYKKFHNSCRNKYSFVENYYKMLESPSKKYVRYRFQIADRGMKGGSGLGDKLAGLTNAFVIAARFNRTLLIESADNSEFGKYWMPHHPAYENSDRSPYHWYNMTWTSYHDNLKERVLDCVGKDNKKEKELCNFDSGDVPEDIINLQSNRAYICRIDGLRGKANADFRNILGVRADANLFEVAGCMLRLAMWPTPLLWLLVEEKYKLRSYNFKKTLFQIGIHYRCGNEPGISYEIDRKLCYYDIKKPRNQQSLHIQKSGGPNEVAICALKILSSFDPHFLRNSRDKILNYEKNETNHNMFQPLVFVTADDNFAIEQITENLLVNNVSNVWIGDKGCQIDFNVTGVCLEITSVWFVILSLSSIIVTQQDNFFPPSGFSRYVYT